ncbi:response regulator transcription factor [Neobacillus sp. MM2021_6]|uniref:response regulator transcription factor n=1 Tax=Bacillaceae TaxID=186817 RepID=UPI0014098E90|nr:MULTISPECIES: response regulator transcription factor [Bacillaceae]MBO0959697.1 response regulator transcription factor [Neobacillus sp. MM2021_6]NHC20463.1 response regulator transcription factor [Bacillus sp. MM2020_4]
MEKRILLVDDEPSILDVCKRYLEREGFLVWTAKNGKEAIELWENVDFTLIILDLMMPVMDGWKVCEAIRESDDIPIIFLTAKGEEYDRLVGLTIGANDYITKPFNPRELVLRVNSICRLLEYRNNSHVTDRDQSSLITTAPFTINVVNREVFLNQSQIDLTMKEFDLLYLLASHPKQVFSRTQLLYQVWQTEFDGDTTTVTVHIRRLREKVEENPSSPKFILTVWGIGYKFMPCEG